MIHITNGDILGCKIQGLSDNLIVWREMYDFGPLNSTWSNEDLIKNRALFFLEKLNIPSTLFIKNCYNQLNLLYKIPKDEEVILWFDHDRYDQTMLMYILSELSINNISNLSMVSVNSYPGQLNLEQLTVLFNQREKISNLQVNEAATGWCAYTSSNLEVINKWIANEHHELPFLLEAFKRHLNYFPSSETGLNEIEYLILKTIEIEECSFRELFKIISPLLINDGLSDLHTAAIVNELINREKGLLKVDGALPSFDFNHLNPNLKLTSNGKRVLMGKANRLDLIGIDWWVGGVHLVHSGK